MVDAVIHRVFHQWLQQQGRDHGFAGIFSVCHATCKRSPGAIVQAPGTDGKAHFCSTGASSRLSASAREIDSRSSSARSARLGSLRIRLSTALILLNRKCGRMRACKACSGFCQCRRKRAAAQIEIAQHHTVAPGKTTHNAPELPCRNPINRLQQGIYQRGDSSSGPLLRYPCQYGKRLSGLLSRNSTPDSAAIPAAARRKYQSARATPRRSAAFASAITIAAPASAAGCAAPPQITKIRSVMDRGFDLY